MPLPVGCLHEGNELVFYRFASEETLANTQGIYEHTCFIACTNAFVPAGDPVVERLEYPVLGHGETVDWGGRELNADDLDRYRDQDFLPCKLHLPIEPMDPNAVPAMPPGHPHA